MKLNQLSDKQISERGMSKLHGGDGVPCNTTKCTSGNPEMQVYHLMEALRTNNGY